MTKQLNLLKKEKIAKTSNNSLKLANFALINLTLDIYTRSYLASFDSSRDPSERIIIFIIKFIAETVIKRTLKVDLLINRIDLYTNCSYE